MSSVVDSAEPIVLDKRKARAKVAKDSEHGVFSMEKQEETAR